MISSRVLLTFLSVIILICSCNDHAEPGKKANAATKIFSSGRFDKDDFSNALRQYMEPAKPDSSRFSTLNALLGIYKQKEYAPVWLTEEGAADMAHQLLNDLDSLRWDGINPSRYSVAALREQLKAFEAAEQMNTDKVIGLDTALTNNYLKASKDLLLGTIRPRSVDSLWFHSNDSTWAINDAVKSIAGGKYVSLDAFRSKMYAYRILQQTLHHYTSLQNDTALLQWQSAIKTTSADSLITAIIDKEVPWLKPISDTLSGIDAKIQSYQQFFGLKRTGKKDSVTLAYLTMPLTDFEHKIRANLERMRWLPTDMEPLCVVVNIPAMQLVLKKDDHDAMRMNVVVGKVARQTPVLNADMANVVINPPWGVPPTILKKDVLPGFSKSGDAYLRKKGLKVYDHTGKQVSSSNVNASNYKRFVFRQPPGDRNALGYVKFNLPNKWDIYLHDTPHRDDFTKYDRAQSSGCIRVQRPKEMAEYILAELEGKRYTMDRIDSVIKTHITRWEILKNKIPVHIIYLTAAENAEGQMCFFRDVYKRDAKLMAAIGEWN